MSERVSSINTELEAPEKPKVICFSLRHKDIKLEVEITDLFKYQSNDILPILADCIEKMETIIETYK